jgi:hypothetical protein
VPEYADMAGVVRVIRVADAADGQFLQLVMDAESDRALAYLAGRQGKTGLQNSRPQSPGKGQRGEKSHS